MDRFWFRRARSREAHVATAERSPFAESQRGLRARETRDSVPPRFRPSRDRLITLHHPSTQQPHDLPRYICMNMFTWWFVVTVSTLPHTSSQPVDLRCGNCRNTPYYIPFCTPFPGAFFHRLHDCIFPEICLIEKLHQQNGSACYEEGSRTAVASPQ